MQVLISLKTGDAGGCKSHATKSHSKLTDTNRIEPVLNKQYVSLLPPTSTRQATTSALLMNRTFRVNMPTSQFSRVPEMVVANS